MPDEMAVRRAGELSGEQIDRVREIYEQAFLPELRVPFAELATPTPSQLMLVAMEGTEPVGFAANLLLGDAGWTFLRYYAVSAGRRRQGAGFRFWQLVLPALTGAGWPTSIVFEVEDPAEPGCEPAEQRIRDGRIAFWQRCGARLLDVPGYIMPNLTGLAGPEPMRLMAWEETGAEPLAPAQVAGLVETLYSVRYGLRADHPMVTAALASISRCSCR